MDCGKKQLVLNKGSEKYIFRFDAGQEGALLDALVASATNPRTDFDWFDAAVLSFRLTQSLIGQADQLLQKDIQEPFEVFENEFESDPEE